MKADVREKINHDGDIDRKDHDLRGRKMTEELEDLERNQDRAGDREIFGPSSSK
jgi:hypothetical protein